MTDEYTARAESAVTGAALQWRAREDLTEQARQALIDSIDQAAERGISEIKLARWAGVSRATIRSWRGKS